MSTGHETNPGTSDKAKASDNNKVDLGDLPPYAPTADVPLRHQDDLTARFSGVAEKFGNDTVEHPLGTGESGNGGTGDRIIVGGDARPSFLTRKRIATSLVLAGAALTVFSWQTFSGGASAEKSENDDPSASATANSGETDQPAAEITDPDEAIGKLQTGTPETLNGPATEELIVWAEEPVSLALGPKEAFKELGDKHAILIASGEVESASGAVQTPKSVADGEAIEQNIFSVNTNGEYLTYMETLRTAIAERWLYYYSEDYKATWTNLETGNEEDPTYRYIIDAADTSEIVEGEPFSIVRHPATNFPHMNDRAFDNSELGNKYSGVARVVKGADGWELVIEEFAEPTY